MAFTHPALSARAQRPVAVTRQVAAVLDGRDVAEALTTRQRELVVVILHGYGWDDAMIADHVRSTRYTIARIRTRLLLPDNNTPHVPHTDVRQVGA